MIFSFRNLGVVETATIELRGLTVICGLNDTGKSFISKTIYSIIKTVNESNEQAIIEKYTQIEFLINQIASSHRQFIAYNQQKYQLFNPNEISGRILNSLLKKAPELETKEIVDSYIEKIIKDLELFKNTSLPISAKNNIDQHISKVRENYKGILTLIKEETDDEKKFKSFFDKVIIKTLFQGQLNSLNRKDSVLSITISEGVNNLINIDVKENKTQRFRLDNSLLLNDVTFIETPTIIQLASFITKTLAFPTTMRKLYQQRTELPLHYYDLIEKINNSGTVPDVFQEIFIDTKKIIDGSVLYKIDERRVVFERNDGATVQVFNMASGIKSFGIIQLLLNSGSINQNSVLIIDEPEVHLHPQWEIEYAKIIVELSKIGIRIIISSHSPYLLRALAYYVEEYKTNEITKFYFGKKEPEKTSSIFTDVTDNLEPIFKALATPMQKLL
jgi:predicted ATP-dependent endonuclease of OLD family